MKDLSKEQAFNAAMGHFSGLGLEQDQESLLESKWFKERFFGQWDRERPSKWGGERTNEFAVEETLGHALTRTCQDLENAFAGMPDIQKKYRDRLAIQSEPELRKRHSILKGIIEKQHGG